MTETTREARLRSALEAALVALEVAADPASDIDPEGFATIARVCRATLEETGRPSRFRPQRCGKRWQPMDTLTGKVAFSAALGINYNGAGGHDDGYGLEDACRAACRELEAAPDMDGSPCLTCRSGGDCGSLRCARLRPFDPRADAPEGALNARDVRELSLESIVRDGGR